MPSGSLLSEPEADGGDQSILPWPVGTSVSGLGERIRMGKGGGRI